MILQPRPQAATPTLWQAPQPEIHQLANGLQVQLFELPGRQIISMALAMQTPISNEQPNEYGASWLTAATADDGSVNHPGSQLAQVLGCLGAAFTSHCSRSYSLASISVARSKLLATLPIFAELILQPAFAQEDIDHNKAELVARLAASYDQPTTLVGRATGLASLKPGSRDAMLHSGPPSVTQKLTRQQLFDWHGRYWRPDQAVLVVSGELPTGLLPAIERVFGGWPATGVQTQIPDTSLREEKERKIWVLDRPNAVQTELRLASLLPNRAHPDWLAVKLASCILGGSFKSRLNAVLREELGYTYGAGADCDERRGSGLFIAGTNCRTEVTGDVLRQMLRILDVSAAPFTELEAKEAKNYMLGSTRLHFQQAESFTDLALDLFTSDFDIPWFNNRQRVIRELSVGELMARSSKYLQPAKMDIVLCGQLDSLRPQLAQLGLEYQQVRFDDEFNLEIC